MDKNNLIAIFEEIALLLELKSENPFKIRAYTNAARTLEFLEDDLEEHIKNNSLEDIKGIGKAIAEKIIEYKNTGKINHHEKLKADIPEGLFDMLKIPGLGPKKVKVLYDKLGISTIGELEYACKENRLVELDGFGVKTQDNIIKGLEYMKKNKGQYLYGDVYEQAMHVLKQMSLAQNVIRYELAGSLRRKKEIIKDIDMVASSNNPRGLVEEFCSFPYIDEIIAKGDTKVSVRLNCGINMDLRVVSDKEYPYALNHFTGSKEHNTAIRHRAKEMGIKVNEYGLFKGDELLECKTEEDIYKTLGLNYIEPELRENNGEIEASEINALPKLVTKEAIKGTFHIHTIYSDGTNTIEELAVEAKRLGLSYIGISDHSRTAFYARGIDTDDLKRQFEEIDRINAKYTDFKIFKGIESDILPDGSLDYEDDILSMFDFVVASVHTNMKMDKKSMTQRIIKAIENKYMTMLGHPTGRLLLARDAYEVDIHEIIDAAARWGKLIEINSSPQRLDLDWRYIKYAKEKGVKFSINTDAHELRSLGNLAIGVGVARKGWLSSDDVINTKKLSEIKELLGR